MTSSKLSLILLAALCTSAFVGVGGRARRVIGANETGHAPLLGSRGQAAGSSVLRKFYRAAQDLGKSRDVNRAITLRHAQLSDLHRAAFPEHHNFHTWAVWGSDGAGRGIRRQQVPHLRKKVLASGGALGLGAVALVSAPWWVPFASAGAALAFTESLMERAGRWLLAANLHIVDDIGPVTERFVHTFRGMTEPDPEKFERFVNSIRPGRTEDGGQDLLREGYGLYYEALFEADAKVREELVFAGSTLISWHEQAILEPYMHRALPVGSRRFLTKQLWFKLGKHDMVVRKDVPNFGGPEYPSNLREITDPRVQSVLDRLVLGRSQDSLAGSRSKNWTDLPDRMNYIIDLMRGLHQDPEVANHRLAIAVQERHLPTPKL